MALTRRELAAALATTVAAAAQTETLPATPEEQLKAARDRIQAAARALDRTTVPMATEPAFRFQA